MGKKLTNIVCGTLMGVTALFAPIKSHAEELIEGYFEKVYPIEMVSEYGERTEEVLEIETYLYVGEEENTLHFSYITEDWNKENWSKEEQRIPLPARYTNINHNFTEVYILHPKEVEISDVEQMVYLVPQHERESLKPLEESPRAQIVLKAGELLVDWALTKIPFANQLLDEFIEYSIQKSEEHYNEIFKEINENYTATQISSFPVDRFGGFIETARGYMISFDMSEAPQREIPMSLWVKIALGNPSQSAHGSFPNRYGELENIIINFSLMGEKEIEEVEIGVAEEVQGIERYFLQGDELEYIRLSEESPEAGLPSNPYMGTPRQVASVRMDNLTGAGLALYLIPNNQEDGKGFEFYLNFFEFRDEVSAWDYIQTRVDPYETGGYFVTGNVMSLFYEGLNRGIEERERTRQRTIFWRCLIDYQERLGAEPAEFRDDWFEDMKANLEYWEGVIEGEAEMRDTEIGVAEEVQGIERYFLQGSELEFIRLSEEQFQERYPTNPYMLTPREIASAEVDNLIGASLTSYIIPNNQNNTGGELHLGVLEFKDESSSWEYVQSQTNQYWGEGCFVMDNILSWFAVDEDLETEGQKIILYKSMIDYQKRLNAEPVTDWFEFIKEELEYLEEDYE